MHNDFVIIGPEEDPAGIKGLMLLKLMIEIAETEVTFYIPGR